MNKLKYNLKMRSNNKIYTISNHSFHNNQNIIKLKIVIKKAIGITNIETKKLTIKNHEIIIIF